MDMTAGFQGARTRVHPPRLAVVTLILATTILNCVQPDQKGPEINYTILSAG